MFPSLVEDENGNIWVVWVRFSPDGTSIYRGVVTGQNEMLAEELVPFTDNCEKRSPSMISLDSERMLLVWISRKGKDQEIRHAIIRNNSVEGSNLIYRSVNAQRITLGKTNSGETFVLWDSAHEDRNNLFLCMFNKDDEFFHPSTLLESDTGENLVGNSPSLLMRDGEPSILFFCNENADILFSIETARYNETSFAHPTFSKPVPFCITGAIEDCPVAVEKGEETYLFWISDYTGDNEVFFCHSSYMDDFGRGGIQYNKGPRNIDEERLQFVKNLTMDPNQNNSNPDGYFCYDIFSSVALIGDELWVVWDSYQWDIEEENNRRTIKYVKTKNGDSWSQPTTIVDSNETKVKGRDDRHPAIIQTENDTIWLFWHSDRYQKDSNENYEICYIKSEDGGKSWIWEEEKEDRNPFRLTESAAKDMCPSVSSIGNKIFVVWQSDRRLGDFDIYYCEFDGKDCLAEKCIADNDTPELNPSIVSWSGRFLHFMKQEEHLAVAWEYAEDIDFIINYRVSGLEGDLIQISAPQNMSTNFPSVAYVSGEIWLIWQYGEVTGDWINVSCSKQSGEEIPITDDFSFNERPVMIEFKGKTWFFWDSSGNGNGRGIYYKYMYTRDIPFWVLILSAGLVISWFLYLIPFFDKDRQKIRHERLGFAWNFFQKHEKRFDLACKLISLLGAIVTLIWFVLVVVGLRL